MIRIVDVYSKRLVRLGLVKDGKVYSINGKSVSDLLDVNFYGDREDNVIEFEGKNGKKKKIVISQRELREIEFEPLKPKRCGANCIFCFVEQLPKGLRKSLYHKDEDYRFSYIYGNFVTLANLQKKDLKKIALYRLSPLYISVHTTDPKLRGMMLGLKKSAPILPYIRFLSSKRIIMHCQIVLCPGINDSKNLLKTIADLSRYYPYVQTVAVVPVGLTSHREGKFPLSTYDEKGATLVVREIKKIQKEFMKKMNTPFVYLSDEFYLLAKRDIPKASFYGDFAQIENGVGITRKFIDDAEKILDTPLRGRPTDKKIAVITGMLSHGVVSKFLRRLIEKTGLKIELYPVENKLFGKTVTVTGLLSGKDIMEALHDKSFDVLFIPNVMLRDMRDTFLDDRTVHDLKRYFQCPVYTFEPLLSKFYKRLIEKRLILL